MNSRERVLCALNHTEPDRVPTDLWLSAGMEMQIREQLGLGADGLRDQYDIDLRYIPGPAFVGPPLRRSAPGDPDGPWAEDLWGVRRRLVTIRVEKGAETYQEVADAPLAGAQTEEDILTYNRWPSADWFDYSAIAAQCRAVHAQGRAAVFQGDRLNRIAQLKPAMYLRGIEQILLDMSLQPDIARTILAHIRTFYLAYAERILEAARGELDIVLTGDDFGTQMGPMASPQMWSDLLGDGFAQYVALIKSYGVPVMHHTCGAVGPLIPLFVERGLDVLQSLQPEASGMDPRILKTTYGARLSFHGGISIQQTLPHGTEEDIRQEVRERVEALAPGGGYILGTSHNIQADTPVRNVLALLQAYQRYGRRS